LRFIFKLLIGMIIFNAFLFIFSAEFGGDQGQDILEKGENKPGSLGYDVDAPGFAYSVITAGGAIFLGASVASWLTKNPAWTGAGVLGAIIFSVYTIGMASMGSMFQSYPFALHIWTIFNFCFGIIATIAIAEVFTGRSVDD